MSALIECQHHDHQVLIHCDSHWNLCGCSGDVHLACEPIAAPAGTPRPTSWPIFRTWRTEAWQPGWH